MSEIRVTTISDAAGTGPVTLTKQQAAKVVLLAKQSDASILYSFGVSSLSDDGTGKTTVTFATAFSSANYAITGLGGENGSIAQTRTLNIGTMAAGSSLILGHTTSGLDDLNRIGVAYLGDLA